MLFIYCYFFSSNKDKLYIHMHLVNANYFFLPFLFFNFISKKTYFGEEKKNLCIACERFLTNCTFFLDKPRIGKTNDESRKNIEQNPLKKTETKRQKSFNIHSMCFLILIFKILITGKILITLFRNLPVSLPY